jgi:hypothetical protein
MDYFGPMKEYNIFKKVDFHIYYSHLATNNWNEFDLIMIDNRPGCFVIHHNIANRFVCTDHIKPWLLHWLNLNELSFVTFNIGNLFPDALTSCLNKFSILTRHTIGQMCRFCHSI